MSPWLLLIPAALIVGAIYQALPDIIWRMEHHRRRVIKRRRKAAKLRRHRHRRRDARIAMWMSLLPERRDPKDAPPLVIHSRREE